MTEERKAAWGLVFLVLCKAWQGLEADRQRIEVWEAALSDLSSQELLEGARRLVSTWSSSFAPPPAALRDAVHGPLVKVPVVYEDNFGGVPLRNGVPQVMLWVQVRVPPGHTPPEYLRRSEARNLGLLGKGVPKALGEARVALGPKPINKFVEGRHVDPHTRIS